MKRLLPAVFCALAAISTADAATRFTAGPVARVPFEVRSHHVVARGSVNGDSAWIVVDTGAGSSVVDDDYARRLKLEAVGEAEAMGAGGTVTVREYGSVTIGLPGIEVVKDGIPGIPLAALAVRGGHPMDVILGHELFEQNVVVLDYAAGVMEIYERGRARPPARGVASRLTFEHNHPYVEGEITFADGRRRAGRFVLDTGSSLGLMLVARGDERAAVIASFPRTLESFGRGVGGELQNVVGRAGALRVGGLTVERPIVVVPAANGGRIAAPGTIGNIGGAILSRHRVTFDYAGAEVRFERGAGAAEPFETDMSGAAITMEAEGYTVRRVANDSPASDAGLREGDLVLAVDGKPAAGLTLSDLRQLLQGEGRRVKLEVKRAGERHAMEMTLRRLI